MAVSLRSVENIQLSDNERAIFNVLRATLQHPANAKAKAVKLADDINFFYESWEKDTDVVLCDTWRMVIKIASCIPPLHPWQKILAQSLHILRQRRTPLVKHDGSAFWKDLPFLSYQMREHWNDPTRTGKVRKKELSKWKNLNSFAVQVTSTDFAPWLTLPIWQLRAALEEPTVKGSVMDCRLWVATEWIVIRTGIIYEKMNSKEELDESTARELRGGSLYEDIPPLSIERWELWKKRFSELDADASRLKLDSSTTEGIPDALHALGSMNGVKDR